MVPSDGATAVARTPAVDTGSSAQAAAFWEAKGDAGRECSARLAQALDERPDLQERLARLLEEQQFDDEHALADKVRRSFLTLDQGCPLPSEAYSIAPTASSMGPIQAEMHCISLKVQSPFEMALCLPSVHFCCRLMQVQELLKDHPDVVASLNKLFDKGGTQPVGLREALLR